jgi:uncharacterized protein involved in response to NO
MKMHLRYRSSSVTPASDLPVLRLGFRPFYLGGALLALLWLLFSAALLRAFGRLLADNWGAGWIVAAGLCWCGLCTVRTSILDLADTSANRRQGGLK